MGFYIRILRFKLSFGFLHDLRVVSCEIYSRGSGSSDDVFELLLEETHSVEKDDLDISLK